MVYPCCFINQIMIKILITIGVFEIECTRLNPVTHGNEKENFIQRYPEFPIIYKSLLCIRFQKFDGCRFCDGAASCFKVINCLDQMLIGISFLNYALLCLHYSTNHTLFIAPGVDHSGLNILMPHKRFNG